MKKVLSLLLVFAVVAVTAFANGQVDTGTTGETGSGYPDTVDPFGKYEPGITMTFAKESNAATDFPSGDSYENNNWIRSSFTPVFFKQTIRSEVGERIDITCPIYQGSEWRGVVRTGFVPVVPLENEGPKHLDSME